MAKVSISEAARQAGITRQYFYKKYIDTGKISVEKDADGKNPQIDTAEFYRVFGKLLVDSQEETGLLQEVAPEKDSKIANLEAQLHLKDELLKAKEDHIADLQQSLRILAHKPEPEPILSEPVPPQEKKGIKFFGFRISRG